MISRKDAMSRLTQAELASASMLEFRVDDAIREGDPTRQIRVDITGVPVRVRERVAQAYRDNAVGRSLCARPSTSETRRRLF